MIKRILVGAKAGRFTIVLAASMMMSTPAHAGYAGPGQISNIVVEGQYVLFETSGARVGALPTAPPCSGIQPQKFAFRTDVPGGEGMLAALLTAYTGKLSVSVNGKSTCTIWAENEDVFQLRIQ